jgi:hypothetical protein
MSRDSSSRIHSSFRAANQTRWNTKLTSSKDNVDEGLRKTQITHANQWASELIKAESECLDDWDLFETEIREMYGDPDRQLDASTRACLEIVQGASNTNKTVKAYSNRMRSMLREAG